MGLSFVGFFQLAFAAVFVLVLAMFVVTAVRGLRQWNRNNHAPRLTVEASVVSRRMDVSYHHSSGGGGHHSSSRYYVTFQVASGDRMEFAVAGQEYGQMVEGDFGDLTFQGTRYLSFVRR